MTRLNTPGGSPARLMISVERPGAARHQIRRLQHHAIAVGERRRDLPGGDRDREVPGRDQADDAERLPRHLHLDAGAHRRQLLAAIAQHLAGEELEDGAGAGRLADALGDRLPLLPRQQLAEFVLARENLGADAVEDVIALLQPAHRPLREGRMGRRDRPVRQRSVGPGIFADDIGEIGGVDVAIDLGALYPLAVHVVLELGHGGPPDVTRFSRCRSSPAGEAVDLNAARRAPRRGFR